MAKFAIQINSAPWRGEGCDTAYQFIRAALRRGHEIVRVFFYYEGVYNSLSRVDVNEDGQANLQRWSALAAEEGIDLVVCVSAAARRGLVGPDEAMRQGLETGLAAGFRIAGLGLWLEACLQADRFLAFGS